MKKVVKVKNMTLGKGMPKICVPLVGKTNNALHLEIQNLKNLQFDLVEWRMDYHEDVLDVEKMQQALLLIRKQLGEIPVLATFRSKKEGGVCEVDTSYYIHLNKTIIATHLVDLIDIELFTGDALVKEVVDFAHAHNVKVIMSNHDFHKTPSKEEIINRLCKMQDLNADLPKIAVMPLNTDDVLTLLSATNDMYTKYANRPIITMYMSQLGIISRLVGEIFGSALTFGAAQTASAPGQIPVSDLTQILKVLHNSK